MANDPICGMYVEEKGAAITSDKDGRKYYFCSASCKLQFDKPELEMRILRRALIVAWPVTIIILLLTYLIKTGYNDYIMLVLASVVQFYAGQRFYAGIIDAVKHRSANMDTLIAIGTTAAWGYSAIVTLFPSLFLSGGVFFDTSAMIVSLILTGTYMQRITEAKASNAVSALVALQPKTAHLVEGNGVKDIPIEQVSETDILLVRPGERIPTDSVIIEGESSIYESAVTGESMPITKKEGDSVIGGTVNSSGSLKVKVVRVGGNTVLAQIIKIVKDASSSKVPVQRLADKISSYFVPAVVAIGIAAAVSWYFIGGIGLNSAVLIFVSVLIVACPCALGIATPAALLVASGKAAENGILIKNGESLQVASKVNAIVVDKTGTLTKGKPEVTDIISLSEYDAMNVLEFAAIAEMSSEHPIGKAIVGRAVQEKMNIYIPNKFGYRQGFGITAFDKNGSEITVGNRELFGADVSDDVEQQISKLESEGKTTLIIGVEGSAIGLIALSDTLKKDSKKAIGAFQKDGIEVWLVTGDNARVAESVGRQLGIANVISQAKPEQKMEKVVELQKSGKIVAMIGDGINDAPALTKADLGIAIGAGTEVALQAGGIILMKNSMYDAYVTLELSRRTMAKIRQNLFWAFGYNAVLIPIAAGALIPVFTIGIYGVLPMLAAFAMAFSSVTVVSNSLLLSRFKAH